MHNTWGPPLGLGLLRVASGTGGGASWGLATVVRVSDLFAGLDELDEGLGDHAAVELLEVLQSTFVVAQNLSGISDTQGNHFVGAIRGAVITVRPGLCQTIFRGWSIAAAANTTRRSIQCACTSLWLVELSKDSGTRLILTAHRLLETDTFPENLEEVLADLWGEDGGFLFLNRGRLVDLELALVVEIDQSVVSIGHTEGWGARWGHHGLELG